MSHPRGSYFVSRARRCGEDASEDLLPTERGAAGADRCSSWVQQVTAVVSWTFRLCLHVGHVAGRGQFVACFVDVLYGGTVSYSSAGITNAFGLL